VTSGGSPRYALYRCADGRFLALASLEQKFWDGFCAAIGLEAAWHDDARDPAAVTRAVAARIRAQPASHWREAFAGKDVCACLVKTVREALADAHFIERGLFAHRLVAGGRQIPALPVPVAPAFRGAAGTAGYPLLGEDNALLDMLGAQ
jgi:crotonobetainyl-CoA:carnitine CoA-transferase CaiB-like acyl-CoA transferase